MKEDSFLNEFEANKGYEVLKWTVLNELNGPNAYLFELHLSANDLGENRRFRIRLEKFSQRTTAISSKKATEHLNRIDRLAFINAHSADKSNVKHLYVDTGANLLGIFRQLVQILLNDKLYAYDLSLPDNGECIGSSALQIVKQIEFLFKDRPLNNSRFLEHK